MQKAPKGQFLFVRENPCSVYFKLLFPHFFRKNLSGKKTGEESSITIFLPCPLGTNDFIEELEGKLQRLFKIKQK